MKHNFEEVKVVSLRKYLEDSKIDQIEDNQDFKSIERRRGYENICIVETEL